MQLLSSEFPTVSSLFSGLSHHLSIQGVLMGAVEGNAWADAGRHAAMLQSPQGIFFGGKPEPDFLASMRDTIRDGILPRLAEAKKLDYVVFFPPGLLRGVEEALRDLEPLRDLRVTLTRETAGLPDALPEGVVPVDARLLSREGLKGLDGLRKEILSGWLSLDAFLEKGFGSAVIAGSAAGERILSWCTTDWVVGDGFEVGIETDPDFRRQGHGARAALGTLVQGRRRGLRRAGWQCWASNTGSLAVARKAGFAECARYPVLFGWARPLNNKLVNGNYWLNDHPDAGVARDLPRAARCYAAALDAGWDWGGRAVLYWNAACLFFRSGEPERARRYFAVAREKGFLGVDRGLSEDDLRYVYHEPDAAEIYRKLKEGGA